MQININHQGVKKAMRKQKIQMIKYLMFNYRHIFSKCHKNLSYVYQKQADILLCIINNVAVQGFKDSEVQGYVLVPGLHFVLVSNPER